MTVGCSDHLTRIPKSQSWLALPPTALLAGDSARLSEGGVSEIASGGGNQREAPGGFALLLPLLLGSFCSFRVSNGAAATHLNRNLSGSFLSFQIAEGISNCPESLPEEASCTSPGFPNLPPTGPGTPET